MGPGTLSPAGLPGTLPTGGPPGCPARASAALCRRLATTTVAAAPPLQTEGRKTQVTMETGDLGSYRESYRAVTSAAGVVRGKNNPERLLTSESRRTDSSSEGPPVI